MNLVEIDADGREAHGPTLAHPSGLAAAGEAGGRRDASTSRLSLPTALDIFSLTRAHLIAQRLELRYFSPSLVARKV
jgi:hypothetical protein